MLMSGASSREVQRGRRFQDHHGLDGAHYLLLMVLHLIDRTLLSHGADHLNVHTLQLSLIIFSHLRVCVLELVCGLWSIV